MDYVIVTEECKPLTMHYGQGKYDHDIVVYGTQNEALDDWYKNDLAIVSLQYTDDHGKELVTLTIEETKIGEFTCDHDNNNEFQEKLWDAIVDGISNY